MVKLIFFVIFLAREPPLLLIKNPRSGVKIKETLRNEKVKRMYGL